MSATTEVKLSPELFLQLPLIWSLSWIGNTVFLNLPVVIVSSSCYSSRQNGLCMSTVESQPLE